MTAGSGSYSYGPKTVRVRALLTVPLMSLTSSSRSSGISWAAADFSSDLQGSYSLDLQCAFVET